MGGPVRSSRLGSYRSKDRAQVNRTLGVLGLGFRGLGFQGLGFRAEGALGL